MIFGARRLLRLTVATEMALEGMTGPVPPLWQVALLGPRLGARSDTVQPDSGSGSGRTDSGAAGSGPAEPRGVEPDGVKPGRAESDGVAAGRDRAAAAAGDREPAA
jgi:hypothetical protein